MYTTLIQKQFSDLKKCLLTCILWLIIIPYSIVAQVVDNNFPVISQHGDVEAITMDEDYYYVGGFFDIVGPPQFNMQILNRSDLSVSDGWPGINTKVHAALSDNNGGFYICTSASVIHLRADKTAETILNEFVSAIHETTDYLYVGNNELKRIIKTTNQVDATFDPIAVSGNIAVIAENEDYLFIGGNFTLIDEPTVKNLVRIPKATFIVDELWALNPVATSYAIRKLLLIDGYLYLGGQFTSIDGENQAGIARVDMVSYEFDEQWRPTLILGEGVKALTNEPNFLYVGGNFSATPGQTNICRIDLITGDIDETFDVSFSVVPESLYIADNKLYVGASAMPLMLYYLSRVDLTTYIKEPFYLPDNGVYEITGNDDYLLFGGEFNTFDGVLVDDICKINANDYSIVEDFTSVGLYHVYSLENYGPYLYIGDNNNLKTLNKETGLLSDHLALDLNGYVFDMEIVDDFLYIAGDFNNCNGLSCNSIIRFDLINETIDLDWLQASSSSIRAISYYNGYLYVTGSISRNNDLYVNLARIDINTGIIDPLWAPENGGNGSSVYADKTGVYVSENLKKYDFTGNLLFDYQIDANAILVVENKVFTTTKIINDLSGVVLDNFNDRPGWELFYDDVRNKVLVGGDIDKSILMLKDIEYQGIEWNGLEDNDWFNAQNWDKNRMPEIDETVRINPSLYNPVINTSEHEIQTIENLELNHQTLLTIGENCGLTVSGNIINPLTSELVIEGSLINNTEGVIAQVKKQISGTEQFHFIGSPVSSINWGDPFTTEQLDHIWVRQYNEGLGDWESIYAQDDAVPGKGYSIWLDESLNTVTANFEGSINVSDISPVLTNNGTTGNQQYDGWNLISNPFAAALDWDHADWNRSDLDGSVYTWDALSGNYVSWNGSAGSLTDGVLPVAQGFFVKANGPTPTLTIPAAARMHHAQDFYKEAVANVLELNVSTEQNTFTDATFILFNPMSSVDFDQAYDAYKLFGIAEAPQLYTKTGDITLSINTLPEIAETLSIEVGFEASTEGNYTISAENILDFELAEAVNIEDKHLNSIQNLKEQPSYTFFASGAENPDRFRISFGITDIMEQEQTQKPRIWYANEQLFVANPQAENGTLTIYDVSGKAINQLKLNGNAFESYKIDLTKGVYVISCLINKSATHTKIVVAK